MKAAGKPAVRRYTEYRKFLRDYYDYEKKRKYRKFTFRSFSKAAGFASPNFYQLVMQGKRNISNDGIQKFVRALGLNRFESRHFQLLVHADQAETLAEKNFYFKQMADTRAFRKVHLLSVEQLYLFSSWYLVATLQLIELSDFVEDPEWIANKLCPKIRPREASRALDALNQLGLVKRDSKGKLVRVIDHVRGLKGPSREYLAQFQRNMIQLGGEAVDRFPSEDRETSCLTVTISKKTFEEIQRLILETKQKASQISDKDHQNDQVYQINFQLFPLSI